MDAQGKGLVDLHELADALRVMGEPERDVLQLLKELVAPLPDVLQQLQIGFGAPRQHGVPVQYGATVQYGAPQNYAAQAPTMTVTGVDMNRDGIPDVLQQPQISYAAPAQQAAPAVTYSTHSEHAAPALVVDNVSHLEQCEELVTPFLQPQFHSDDVSAVGPKVTLPKWRKAHEVPVRGVVRRPSGRTRQVPLCWHGAQCSWHLQRSLPLRTPGCRCHRTGGDQGRAEDPLDSLAEIIGVPDVEDRFSAWSQCRRDPCRSSSND